MRRAGQLLALFGTDRTDMGNQRHFALRLFRHNFQDLLSFCAALNERFSGRAADVQPINALCNVETHQTAQALNIQFLLVIKRS